MEFSMCSICRTMSRILVFFAVIMVSLVLQQACVSSEPLPEQHCKLRPTIVAVNKRGFKPHHIELHRCQGTCGTSLPSQTPCVAASQEEISLDLTDLTTGKLNKVPVFNHTSCGCHCNVKCNVDDGEIPDEENCRCTTVPTPQQQEGNNEIVDVRPYQIGLVVVGLFALCVLVLDMIMCAKGQGVINKVKEKCCLSEHIDGNRGEVAVSNGKCSAANGAKNGHSGTAQV